MNQLASSPIRLVALSLALASLVGCSAAPEPPLPPGEEHVAKTEQELQQGGCSNAQIRTLQSGCRSACGAGGSAGIDDRYPGTMTAGANVFADTSEGGICVCN